MAVFFGLDGIQSLQGGFTRFGNTSDFGGGNLFDTSSLYNPGTSITLREPLNFGTPKPKPQPKPITKPITKITKSNPITLPQNVIDTIQDSIVFGGFIQNEDFKTNGIKIPDLIELEDVPIGIEIKKDPIRIAPTPPPKPPKPRISRTQGGSTIKEEILSNNVSTEVVDVFKNSVSFLVNVVDDIYVPVPDIREIEYPTVVAGADFRGADVDFDFSWNSVNTTYIRIYIGGSKEYIQVGPKGNQFLNIKKDILGKYIPRSVYDSNPDAFTIPISMIPYNTSGREVVAGKKEKFEVVFDKGDLDIPRSVAVNRILDGFSSQFDFNVFKENKYLNHLLHLGDGDNDIITRFQGLALDDESSLILKLYEPLPTSVQPNQKVWISKLQTEPIIETITIVGQDDEYCPPLQGANFSLEEDNSIGYQIFDDLVASGSASQTSLIREYTRKTGIDTEKLNIQYSSGSQFVFDNFVHFGSAEERIKNFYYKIQVLESYEENYEDLTGANIVLGSLETEDGYVILTEVGIQLESEAPSITTEIQLEANSVLQKIDNVILSFDAFEKFLYFENKDVCWPKVSGELRSSTSSEVSAWYNSSINEASTFDRNNVDYLSNNLPEYIKEDYENEDFILFLDMLGQHFDLLWCYTKALTDINKLDNQSSVGFSNELVYHLLESLGWNGKKAFDSQNLWEYAFGLNKDGTQKYQQSLKSANEEVWRRILNNLPYLLKHKGTARSLKAVMACYGVPQSLLTIMEFGGPQDPTLGGTTNFTYEDRTAAINFTNNGEYVQTPWKIPSGETTTPNSVEFRVNLKEPGDYNIARVFGEFSGTDEEYWRLGVTQTTGSYGYLSLYLSGSITQQTYELSTDTFNIFNDEYTQIVINRTQSGLNNTFQLFAKEAVGDRLRTDIQSDALTITGETSWDTGSLVNLQIGYGMTGSMDEFRLWTTPLEEGVIESHTLLPDSISGNNYSASSEDLVFRLDFEYPKDRTNDNNIINVAIAEKYGISQGTAVGFPSASEYPYQYTPYERVVTAKIPSLGFNYSDKVRFEEQTLVTDLSHKVRATKKSFDQAPIDSSRLGLFFSPTKELNMYILKSFGSFNIDNYIGDPADEYKHEYTELKNLREYYFERLNRNIDEYIQLVRYIDKSLFDVLQDLVPARAKVSKGLLIEPHLLERNKTKWDRPTSETGHYESNVEIDYVEFESENPQYLATLDAENDINLVSDTNHYDATITDGADVELVVDYATYTADISTTDDTSIVVDYPTYEMEIDADVAEPTIQTSIEEITSFNQVGTDPELVVNGGFGLYAEDGVGIVTTLDIFGNMTSSRQQIYKVKESYIEKEKVQTQGWPATTGSEQVRYEFVDVTKYKYVISKVPFGDSAPSVGGNVVEVTPLNGYFPSHYRRVNNLGEGLRRSFFKGSQQTAATTPDGLEPVETFTTNPNILRVANTGRGSGEPILEVD